MAVKKGIFGDGANLKDRYIPDHKKLAKQVKHWREIGLKIVLASGTWDLFHVGHAQYLEKAKALGDLLIVGVDSDEKVRARKGPHRPVVPEMERVHILAHLRHVDVITLKPYSEKPNQLIKLIRPDVLVMSKSTKHKPSDIREKRRFVGAVVLLEPQAETSTSAKVRLLHVSGADRFAKEVAARMPALMEDVMNDLAKK
jgi:D-glycero-beta-D-manno-heptose 1-phosphate adenylyltransferase